MATPVLSGSPSHPIPDEFKGPFSAMTLRTASLARAAFINFVIGVLTVRERSDEELIGIAVGVWGLDRRAAQYRLDSFLERGWLPATRTEENDDFVWRYRRP